MPQLVDLLRQSVNNSNEFDSAWYVKFAFELQMDISKAQKLFENHGTGYIYSSTGFAMPDTPRTRYKMVSNFVNCVIVNSDGKIWVRTPNHIGSINRKRHKHEDACLRSAQKSENRQILETRKRNLMFEDGKTSPSPKRGGKANSHSDIGKYNNFRSTRMQDVEPRRRDVLVTININI